MDNERRKIDLDWYEPIDVYAMLRDRGAMLLDGMGAHPDARYAYVAFGFQYEARLDDHLHIRHADGRIEERHGPPLELIQGLADEMRRDEDEPEGFTGGLVGYFGYEFLQAVEPTLATHAADTPDALLWLAQGVVVFDRQIKQAWAWCNGPDAEGLAAILRDALARTPDVAWPRPSDGQWATSLTAQAFADAVQRMRQHIQDGDLYQANIATRFSIPLDADPVALYRALARDNPSPFMALIEAGDHSIVSCSPEQLLSVHDGMIRSRPIAGTRPRDPDAHADAALEADLLADPKEQAEHTMLVDLLRNDVAKVSVPGTVCVDELMTVERYRHVMHLVSNIQGAVRPDTCFTDWLAALFPGGTITGTPKHRACQRIHEAERVPRGPYTGSAGFLSWSHNAHWNIMIRTLVLKDHEVRVHAGSGIVADSQPEREWREAANKAQALLDAACGVRRSGGDRLGEATRHDQWTPPHAPPVDGCRVFIVDNYDSFTYNLADYCAALGAKVMVRRNDAELGPDIDAFEPTHIIIGPGPGRPEDSRGSLDVLAAHHATPMLGVCLGMQAMLMRSGAPIDRTGPVHGKTSPMQHAGTGILQDLPPGADVARYHSLGLRADDMPDDWRSDGHLDDGTVMAVHHETRPWWGVQFHPESIGTPGGLGILRRFLEA